MKNKYFVFENNKAFEFAKWLFNPKKFDRNTYALIAAVIISAIVAFVTNNTTFGLFTLAILIVSNLIATTIETQFERFERENDSK